MTTATNKRTQLAWTALSNLSGLAGAVLTRQLLQRVWTAVSDADREPPFNPADRRIGWSTALQWAVAAGVGAGVARVVSQRVAAAGWEAATGGSPPGLRTE